MKAKRLFAHDYTSGYSNTILFTTFCLIELILQFKPKNIFEVPIVC